MMRSYSKKMRGDNVIGGWNILLVFLFFILDLTMRCDAVLSKDEHPDITVDTKYGCIWRGGISSSVVCNCREDAEELYVQPDSISSYSTSAIELIGCPKVKFAPNSIAGIRNLRTIHLRNINALEFEESSLNWYGYRERGEYEERYDMSVPSLKIIVENCTITRVASYTFRGRINTIIFDDVLVEILDSFAFTSLLQTQRIIFRNTELKTIHLQPFKRLSAEILELKNVVAEDLPSRFLSNVTIYEKLQVIDCQFTTIRSGAFLVDGPKSTVVSNSDIGRLYGDAFRLTTKGDIVFEQNRFGTIDDDAFAKIVYDRADVHTAASPRLTLTANAVGAVTRNSFRVNGYELRIYDLQVNTTCDCGTFAGWSNAESYDTEIKCMDEDGFVTIRDYRMKMCSLIQSHSTVFIVVMVVLTALIIIGTLLVIYYRRVYKSGKYANEKNSKNNLSLIVPDGRTYRETEVHVIVERADLLTTDL